MLSIIAILLLAAISANGANAPAASEAEAAKVAKAAENYKKFLIEVPPTKADVPYGSHPKQVLHFWKAASDKPTPLLFYIHGGGWTHGDRALGASRVKNMLAKSKTIWEKAEKK